MASNGSTIPCWRIVPSNTGGEVAGFVNLESTPFVGQYQSTYVWMAFALLFAWIGFHFTMSGLLNHSTIHIYNSNLSSSWFRYHTLLLVLLSVATDVLFTWFTFAQYSISPNSSFSIASYLTFCMWLTWLCLKIAKITSLVQDDLSLSASVPLLNLFVIFFGYDSSFPIEELSAVLGGKIVEILFLDSWTKFVPLIIASALSVSSPLNIASLTLSLVTLCLVCIQYSKMLLFKPQQVIAPLRCVVAPPSYSVVY